MSRNRCIHAGVALQEMYQAVRTTMRIARDHAVRSWRLTASSVFVCGTGAAPSSSFPLACSAWLASVAVTAAVLSPIEGGPVRAVLIIGALMALTFCVLPARGARPSSQAQIQQIVRRVFPDDQARALCISDHESDGTPHHWTPTATNGSNTGLFQIDRNTWDWRINPRAIPIVGRLDWSRMLDPLYNARAARLIYRHSGWLPWSTRGLCGA